MNDVTVEEEMEFEPNGVCQEMTTLLCRWDKTRLSISVAEMVDNPEEMLGKAGESTPKKETP